MDDSHELVHKLYQTLPLHDKGLGVRLLDILPGSRADPIRCKLVVKQLTGTTHFEAVSYTWGTMTKSEFTQLNGVRVAITSNLECALRHLRKATRKRRIWVDALCINQDDLRERAIQVMKMGQIYRNATQVLIWLGHGDAKTQLAFRYMRWCLDNAANTATFDKATVDCCPLHYYSLYWSQDQEQDRRSLGMRGFECFRCKLKCQCDVCLRTQNMICAGLSDLLHRNWWHRIWVVQEVAMAAGDPLVGCGESWMPWTDLVKYERSGEWWPGRREAIVQLHGIRLDVKKPPRLRNLATPIPYSSHAAAADDIFHWLRRTVDFEATDPRDKIFALLGMARSKAWREMVPDYTMSTSALLHNLVFRMIRTDNNLDILTLCRPGNQSYTESRPPSWIPDFQSQGLPYLATMGHLNAMSPIRPLVERLSPQRLSTSAVIEIDATVLQVSGFVIDTVSSFTENHQHLLPGQSRGLLKLFEKKNDFGVDVLNLWPLFYWHSVWRALDPAYWESDEDLGAIIFMQTLDAYLDAMKQAVERRLVDKAPTEPPANKRLVDGINRALEGRTYFVTSKGLLGIGPSNIRDGDKVVLLNGSSAAFALRTLPATTSSSTGCGVGYELVGNVFIDAPPPHLPWPKPIPEFSWTVEDACSALFRIW